MPQASFKVFASNSRLMRLLHELDLAAKHDPNHRHFADKLGRLLDLSDAFAMSDTLRGLDRTAFMPSSHSADAIREDFLARRTALIALIGQCFAGKTADGMPILPPPNDDMPSDDGKAFEPCQRFYSLLQSELEVRCRRLRGHLRKALAGQSPRLAQLAALDSALGDTLSPQLRHYYALVPQLLDRRFRQLREQYHEQLASDPEQWLAPGDWLAQFYREMQSLLLAELELRLQTAIGLIEALDEKHETTHN